MTEQRIENIVEKLKKIIATNYSEYAGFNLQASKEDGFYNCFIVNNEELFPSNFSIKLESFNDSIKIIQKITGQNEEKILEDLDANGSYYSLNKPLFLHYLKMPQQCEE